MDEYERRKAIQEGHRNAREERFFAPRPNWDNDEFRHIFREGFDRGWEEAHELLLPHNAI